VTLWALWAIDALVSKRQSGSVFVCVGSVIGCIWFVLHLAFSWVGADELFDVGIVGKFRCGGSSELIDL
jgi:hypothetical protein